MNRSLQPAFACVAGLCLLAASLVPAAASAGAGQRTALGKKLAQRKLKSLAGKSEALFDSGRVSVLLFVRPDHEFSRRGMDAAATAIGALERKPVEWIVLTSGGADNAKLAEEIKAAGLAARTLVDDGDKVYGELGVKVRPTFAILDEDHKVVQWQPFLKINLPVALVARIRHALGEIDDEGLDKALDPSRDKASPEATKAKRLLKMARLLHDKGMHAKAQPMVSKSLEIVPGDAGAHALLGDILAAQKKCPKALASYAEALRLEPKHPAALAGRKACQGK